MNRDIFKGGKGERGRQVKSKYGWCDEVWEEGQVERGGGRSVPQLAIEAVIATTHARRRGIYWPVKRKGGMLTIMRHLSIHLHHEYLSSAVHEGIGSISFMYLSWVATSENTVISHQPEA